MFKKHSKQCLVLVCVILFYQNRHVANKGLFSGLEDLLFYTITEGAEKVPVSHFIAVSLFIDTYTHKHI